MPQNPQESTHAPKPPRIHPCPKTPKNPPMPKNPQKSTYAHATLAANQGNMRIKHPSYAPSCTLYFAFHKNPFDLPWPISVLNFHITTRLHHRDCATDSKVNMSRVATYTLPYCVPKRGECVTWLHNPCRIRVLGLGEEESMGQTIPQTPQETYCHVARCSHKTRVRSICQDTFPVAYAHISVGFA